VAYLTTTLGMKLADPTTIQQFETTQVNANFQALENAILADRGRLDAAETNSPKTVDNAFTNTFNTAKVGNNTTVTTRTIPAQGSAVTVIVQLTGRHGFDTAARDGAITLAVSAGTIANNLEENRTTAPAGKYTAYTATWFVQLTAGQASTLTFKTSSDDTEFWRGEISYFVVPTSKVN
jgi:hypothetical protein